MVQSSLFSCKHLLFYLYTLRILSQQRLSLICQQSSFYDYFIIHFIWSEPSPLTADVLNLGILLKLCEGTTTHSLFCAGSFTHKWQGLGLWTHHLQAAVCPLIFLCSSCCSSPPLRTQPFTLEMPFFGLSLERSRVCHSCCTSYMFFPYNPVFRPAVSKACGLYICCWKCKGNT